MGRKIFQIILAVAIVVLVGIIYLQISTPIKFEDEMNARKAAVIERIKDIRAAERAFKSKYQYFTGDFDTLAQFILTDSIQMERKLVDEDDSVALSALKKAGRRNIETFKVAVIDTVFAPRKLNAHDVKNMRYIPFTNNESLFILETRINEVSKVKVPVIECRAPYKQFLDTVAFRKEIVSMIDNEENNFNRYAGVKFGSLEAANNEAGNWED